MLCMSTGKHCAWAQGLANRRCPLCAAAAGLALLGPIDEKFVSVVDVHEPLQSGQRDKCFISKGCACAPFLHSDHPAATRQRHPAACYAKWHVPPS